MEFTKQEKLAFSKMGKKSVESRHLGKTKEEISQYYKMLRGRPKKNEITIQEKTE